MLTVLRRLPCSFARVKSNISRHGYDIIPPVQGLPAKVFQNLAARESHTCCNDFSHSSAKRMSVEVPLTLVIPLSIEDGW